MKKAFIAILAVIAVIAFSNKPVSAPELTETAETTVVKSKPMTAKITPITESTVTLQSTTQITTIVTTTATTEPRVIKPPKINDPNGLIKSVKQIDLTLPENQSYKDYISACHCSTCNKESTVIETEKEWLYPLGDNYIATNKGKEYNLYYIDGATREKRQILAGFGEGWEDGTEEAYDFLRKSDITLIPLMGINYHYYFVEAIDDSRFIYGIGGWEWSNGYGLFDVARNENLPFRFGDTKWRDEAYERNDCPTHDYLGRVDDKIYCIEANQDNYAGAVDNLDVLEIDLDDYSTTIYPVKLPAGEDVFLSDGYGYSPDMKYLALTVSDYTFNNCKIYLYSIFENEKAVAIIDLDEYAGNAKFVSDKIIYLYDWYDVLYEITLY